MLDTAASLSSHLRNKAMQVEEVVIVIVIEVRRTYSRTQNELMLVCMANVSDTSEGIQQGDNIGLVDGPHVGEHLRHLGQELRLHALLNDMCSAGRLALHLYNYNSKDSHVKYLRRNMRVLPYRRRT